MVKVFVIVSARLRLLIGRLAPELRSSRLTQTSVAQQPFGTACLESANRPVAVVESYGLRHTDPFWKKTAPHITCGAVISYSPN